MHGDRLRNGQLKLHDLKLKEDSSSSYRYLCSYLFVSLASGNVLPSTSFGDMALPKMCICFNNLL